jgi:Cu-Zn family superoxide dismutase
MKTLTPRTLISLAAASLFLSACGERAADEAPADAAAPPATSAPPADSMSGPASEAAVQLSPTEGNTASGMLAVTSDGAGVRIRGSLQGLKPDSEFGFHIHENGDCSAPDASSAGGHFNPTNAQHGNPSGDAHHAGDMLNATSNADGVAEVDAMAEGVTLRTGQANDVFGKAVVLHEKPDDYATQPSGDSGARIACGVISG